TDLGPCRCRGLTLHGATPATAARGPGTGGGPRIMNRTTRALILPALALLALTHPAAAGPVVIEAKHKVRIEHNVLIPVRDGKKLSADLIRPEDDGRYPVIIEYIPYRKDDLTQGGYDAHYYFAERGFVGVRLDVRGTGGSEGVNTDEYMPVEQQDGFDAVEW